jgi:hypothetical protein
MGKGRHRGTGAGHLAARNVAYIDLGSDSSAIIWSRIRGQAVPVIELQLQRVGARLVFFSENLK